MNIRFNKKMHEVYLEDDGTMDTVISVDGKENRFDSEYAAEYRNESGDMTKAGLRSLAVECLECPID